MRHGSLFSGIGGFDLASEWMGWENVFHCEWNEFGQKVLKYYWPKAITYNDITKTDFSIHRGTIDILTGGFPCQPYSSAGKRLGKEDERHLWPEMLRSIREIQPTWVVGENVRGLTNWNGGLVFDEVQADLEAEGYEVTPFLLPAASVNAPHRRDRIWFVAYSSKECSRNKLSRTFTNSSCTRCNRNKEFQEGCDSNQKRVSLNEFDTFSPSWTSSNSNLYGCNECNGNNEVNTGEGRINAFSNIDKGYVNGDASDSNSTNNKTRTQREILGQQNRKKTNGHINVERTNKWKNFPTVSPICDGDDGLSDRLDSITFSKWRNESIKAGGNAVVPQVVYQIFKAIEQYETIRNS
jgi:DNA (cytosine-5)-methyltransferase 1